MASEKHSYQTDAAQLKIDFGELNISPEEETAYKKAQEELFAILLSTTTDSAGMLPMADTRSTRTW